MNLKNKNWKTTGAGVAAILVAMSAALTALTDNDPSTTIDFASLLAACIAGVGLIFARDADKSSDQLGIK
jgi:predicted Zn-dependent protease